MSDKKLTVPEKWIIAGIPIIFLVGSLFHFLFEWSGENKIVGLFAAVNESVWEHIKMIPVPLVLFWSVMYLILGKKYQIDKNKWFTAGLVSLLVSMITMPMLFYFYTGAFGVELLWVDILIFFLSVVFGQLLGLHFYRHSMGINWIVALILMLLVIAAFAVLTYFPIEIPMFKDSNTGQYGIAK